MTNAFRMMVLFANCDHNWDPITLEKSKIAEHISKMSERFPEIVEECSQDDYVVNFYSHQAFDEDGKEVLRTVTTSAKLLCDLQHYVVREVKIEIPDEKPEPVKHVFRLKQNADADCLAAALFSAHLGNIVFVTNGFETDRLEELAETLPLADNKKAKPVFTIGYEAKSCSGCWAEKERSVSEKFALANLSTLNATKATILLAGIFASGKTSNTDLIMDLIKKGADEAKAKEFFK